MDLKPAEIIAVGIAKGGTGKSTTVMALWEMLNERGYKTLAIDLDPQMSLNRCVGLTYRESLEQSGVPESEWPPLVLPKGYASSYDIMKRGSDDISLARKAVFHTPMGDIIPSSQSLQAVDAEFQMQGREYKLKKALSLVRDDYDFIVIDCPPAQDTLTVNALTASDSLIIPTTVDELGLSGVMSFLGTVRDTIEYTNKRLRIDGILYTRFNGRITLAQEYDAMFRKTAGSLGIRVYAHPISQSAVIQKAQRTKQPISSFWGKGRAVVDYDMWVDEFLSLDGRSARPRRGEVKYGI